MNFNEVNLEDAQMIREKLLRTPDHNMEIFAKRLLDSSNSTSLPLTYEMMLMDFKSNEIVKELLQFYCENATIQLQMVKEPVEKRKNTKTSKPTKKTKAISKRKKKEDD